MSRCLAQSTNLDYTRPMPHSYDATGKTLVETFPADWLNQFGLGPVTDVEVISADLATVSSLADKVIRVNEASPWLAHIELQASDDHNLPRRLLRYNVLLGEKHGLPVHTVLVLLRPEADGTYLTGKLELRSPRPGCSLSFEYQVVRLWQLPAAVYLQGGLGTLPLAPLGQVQTDALPSVIKAIEVRVEQEATPALAGSLWVCTFVLMGLRYPRELTKHLLQGVQAMKESVTYQAILEEGEERGIAKGEAKGEAKGNLNEARKLLLRLGTRRFGAPSANVKTAIEAIADLERLELLIERVLDIGGWEELLATH
jgi:predicted transposase YdaD